jgi:hypothetical protein
LWVRSVEDSIDGKMNYSTETKFSNGESIKSESLSEVRHTKTDL